MPVTNSVIDRRVAKTRKKMRDLGLGALVIYSAPTDLGLSTITAGNVRYYANFADKFQPCLMVLPLDADPVLLVYGFFSKRWAAETDTWVKDIRCEEDNNQYGGVARDILRDRGVPAGPVGLIGRAEISEPNYRGLTSEAKPWEFVDADDIMNEDRVVKEPEEIELHRMAAKVSDSMLYHFMNQARIPGKQAWQLMADMENEGRHLYAEYASGWMATGPAPDSITVNLSHNNRYLENGDRVQAGTYVIYDGYWGHELRMGYKGRPPADIRQHYNNIIEVQEIGMRELKPGKRLRDAVKAMEAAQDEFSPYPPGEDRSRFHPGHGLGLSYYDPLVSDAFPQTGNWSDSGRTGGGGWRGEGETPILVQPGMIIELHPNYSTPDHGIITIGDVVLVTETGVELLTSFPREIYEC